jgi:hypothetical protein
MGGIDKVKIYWQHKGGIYDGIVESEEKILKHFQAFVEDVKENTGLNMYDLADYTFSVKPVLMTEGEFKKLPEWNG